MSLQLKEMGSGKGKFPRVEEGTYMGRLASIVDLGVQQQTDWQTGEPSKSQPKILITWELPTERIDIEQEDGTTVSKPRWMSKEYTSSNFDQSNLMKLVHALHPIGIDSLEQLLNKECMINIGSTVNGNAKIVSVVPAPRGMAIDELENPAVVFDFDAPEQELFEKQPAWIQEKIKMADNYSGFADTWGVDGQV